MQVPWLLIGSVTAASVIAVVFVISLAIIIAVCCLKGRSKKEVDLRRQSVISDDGHYYDYVHNFGGTAQTPSCNYSKMRMGGDCHSTQTAETLKRNEAYDIMGNRRAMDIEASQNIAYHSALDIL